MDYWRAHDLARTDALTTDALTLTDALTTHSRRARKSRDTQHVYDLPKLL